jgi:hypothetical protein
MQFRPIRSLWTVSLAKHRFSGLSHMRQCGDDVLRMFVTGASGARSWRHAPAHQHHLTLGVRVPYYGRWIVWKHARHRDFALIRPRAAASGRRPSQEACR